MPFLHLPSSPLAPHASPVTLHYRDAGHGSPILFLHGGWGYRYYPIDSQIEALGSRFRFLIPDRSGYGQSLSVPGELPLDFHRRAAAETLAFLDSLGISHCAFWGHSDGAVIATLIALSAPERCRCLVLEAFHLWRAKPSSRSFFARFAEQPRNLSAETHRILAAEHGDPRWQEVVRRHSQVWKGIGEAATHQEEDFYDGRLGELKVPALFLHGRLDPRTEPGEIERVQEILPQSTVHFIENGKHCPHSEAPASAEFNAALAAFLASTAL
ncbi:MAG: alpha/beta hydrolase [Acidobacteriia bacterium]|nr:alpha/beta hydrolase [Terriglobia bacterium]